MVKCQSVGCSRDTSPHENGEPSILYPYFKASKKFISFLFNIYICDLRHITIECKKCGHLSVTALAQSHVIKCHTNRGYVIESSTTLIDPLHCKGSKCSEGYFEYLDMAAILLRCFATGCGACVFDTR